MNWVDIKYVFNQLRNGKEIPKKSEKAKMLDSDWIELEKVKNVTKYSFGHQGISPGIYLVQAKVRFDEDTFDSRISNFVDANDDEGYALPYYTDANYRVYMHLSTDSFSLGAHYINNSYRATVEVLSVRVKRIM